jgi:hypothetical protein
MLHHAMQNHAREGHLSYVRQACEMTLLKLRYGIGLNYYQTAGFFRQEIPWTDKAAHLGAADLVSRLDRLNPARYRKLSQHKLAEKALLTLLGVPTPAYLGYAHTVAGRTAAGAPLRTVDEFEQFVGALGCERVCFKLVEAYGGRGFVPVELVKTPAATRLEPLFSGEQLTVRDFFDQYIASVPRGRLVEEYIEQHPSYKALNATSVNTFRVWAYAPENRAARVLGAYLRIGRAGSLVDNHEAGGILAPVDFETGTLRAAVDGQPTHRVYPNHPDSGTPIAGIQLDYWRESMELAATTLTAFPETRLAGLDIAVTTTGPVVIELNDYPGLDGVGVSNLQLARLLDG